MVTLSDWSKYQQVHNRKQSESPPTTPPSQLPWLSKIMAFPRRRQLWFLVCAVTLFFYITVTFNSQVWKSLNSDSDIDENDPSGYGFRKLLEDGDARIERLRHQHYGMDQRLPQCIIIGVRKCGTRAL